MAIGKTNAIIGSAENPYIAKTEAEMAKYLADSKKVGSFVQYTGTSGTYVQNEVYRILESGDATQYMPTSELQNITTLKKLLDATKSAASLFSEYLGTTVNELIAYNDTSNVTNMQSMFYGCSKLTTIPPLDRSKVTNMYGTFYGCSSLTSIPQLDTSKVTNMNSMFYGCSKLTTIPQLDTSKVTYMNSMFSGCSKLTTIPQLDTSKVTNMGSMFNGCSSLTSIPQLDTSNVISMDSMFKQCSKLTTIPQFDISKVNFLNAMFQGCSNLKSILMTGMKTSFDISASTKFETSDLVTILNNLATVTSTKTLTMGATNLAKLTDEEKAIATNKGWTLA